MAFSDLFWAAPKISRLASGSRVLAKNGNCKRILKICSAKSVGAVGGGPDETGAFLGRIQLDDDSLPVMRRMVEFETGKFLAQTRNGGLYAISIQ